MEKTVLVLLCLAGFFVPFSNQIRRYYYENTEMSWSEAQSYCREKHTDLATVRSQEEAEQLLNITGGSVNATAWIGLYRDDTQNWQWSNSDDVIFYSNWTANLFCASVRSSGEWRDLRCQEKNPFMCYNETSNITERYTLIEELKTWTEAQQYCREHHTDLVSIKNASENEDLVKKALGKTFWIGLFNNPWKWSHQGDNSTFHNWANGEPNNEKGNEKCVVMNKTGKWYDSSCSRKAFFICCSADAFAPGGSSGNCSFEGTEKTWHEAQSYCRNLNKDLVTIQDQARMKNISGIIPKTNSTWIGLHRDKENWQWSNGGDVIYSNWTPQLFCASVNASGVWNKSLCKEKNPFMCYNETSNIAERYTLIEELKTWTEAQQYCREHHTDLVSIKNASEHAELVKKAQGKPFWIGLFNNPWKWSHQGDKCTFHNWNTGEPNNWRCNEKCVEIALRDSQNLLRGKWNDQDCKLKLPFFCFDDVRDLVLEKENKTWEEAVDHCRAQHRELASIVSEKEQRYAAHLSKRANSPLVWIGLRQSRLFGFWFWMNSEPLDYTQWKGGVQPPAYPDSSPCVAMTTESDHHWTEKPCSEKLNFFCF